jgi:hypothetical protein
MKALSIQVAVVMVALATQAAALAQPPANVAPVRPLANIQSLPYVHAYPYHLPNPNYYGYRAATVGESYARGVAARAYSFGQYNRLTAEARLIHTHADTRDIENYDYGVRTYFEMRQYNRAARAAERGPRATQADLVRFAAQEKPHRLSPGELSNTGEISWPILLQADEFAAFRAELEQTFVQRAADGRVGLEDHVKVSRTAKVMLDVLKTYVSEVDGMDYIAARRFIESLAFEARLPLS